jgi:hypothetical protein
VAKKTKTKKETAKAAAPAEPRKPAGPPPGTVRLVNLTSSERDVTLTDGRNLHMTPWSRTGTGHKSSPVLRKLLPPVVRKMVARGEIRIEEAPK